VLDVAGTVAVASVLGVESMWLNAATMSAARDSKISRVERFDGGDKGFLRLFKFFDN
jgi:hypothetical protein